jgi:hypothetical protein
MQSIDKKTYLIYEAHNYVIKEPRLILMKSGEFDQGGTVMVGFQRWSKILDATNLKKDCELETVVTRELITQKQADINRE